MPPPTLLLTRTDVEQLLDLPACIDAVASGFRCVAAGGARSDVLGQAVDGGGFHAKLATLVDAAAGDAWFAAKLNANFPENPRRHGLPTIQGLLALFDAHTGTVAAVMDSAALTVLRTAAATGLAARYLANPLAESVTIIGCGAQAGAQLAAVCAVRPIRRVTAFDVDEAAAQRFAVTAAERLRLEGMAAPALSAAACASEIIVTCTPSRQPFLRPEHVRQGTFIAAIGADNEEKSEIHPELMARAVVVVDNLRQSATIGDLHHALRAGAMQESDVRAELSQLIVDPSLAEYDPDRITVFDSTGVAVEDVAAAVLVYARACERGVGRAIALNT